ncbi:MAG: thioesterase family protein [Planctomycetota bacterium]
MSESQPSESGEEHGCDEGTHSVISPDQVVFEASRRVEFRDTDAAGITHFSAFFPMMESVEHEFLRSIDVSVMPPHDGVERLTWPRKSVSCDFHGPARFEDELLVTVFIDRLGESSLTYRFEITHDGRPIATGRITAVCCDLREGGKLIKARVPDSLRQKLIDRTT